MKLANEILTTRGVNSCVRTPEDGTFEKGQRWWTNLHIGLYDFDGVKKSTVLDETMDLEGINCLFQSSRNNYHLWNLTAQTPAEIALQGLKMHCDCKHVSHGFKRRKWVLRIAGKFHENETEPYKPEPKLQHTFCNPSNLPQSLPHYRLFQALTGKLIYPSSGYTFLGESAQIEDYKTYTDKMKTNILKSWGRK